jgi:Acetokinase family
VDSNLITAFAGVLGSASGASVAIATTWISQKSQTVRERAKWETRKRETLYGDFITDALIFSGGVGENSAEVREAACKQLAFLGLKLDDAANRRGNSDRDVAAPDSRVRVLIIRAQEDWAIAKECWRVMRVSTDD